jgi:hypothetical protein
MPRAPGRHEEHEQGHTRHREVRNNDLPHLEREKAELPGKIARVGEPECHFDLAAKAGSQPVDDLARGFGVARDADVTDACDHLAADCRAFRVDAYRLPELEHSIVRQSRCKTPHRARNTLRLVFAHQKESV